MVRREGPTADTMTFYLGTHLPNWLWMADVPLFVSLNTIGRYKKPKPATARWCLDSGAFSEVSSKGGWFKTAKEYAAQITYLRETVGPMDWAAPQDWMCEPFITAKTGKTVAEHQRLTVDNFLELRSLGMDCVIPVLQGWAKSDYLAHLDMYASSGVKLSSEKTVGVGSVCRRQGTEEAWGIFRSLYSQGLNLHGFGVKKTGLEKYGCLLQSADSLAWSFAARRQNDRLEGCTHLNCANCFKYAMLWREKLLRRLNENVSVRGN